MRRLLSTVAVLGLLASGTAACDAPGGASAPRPGTDRPSAGSTSAPQPVPQPVRVVTSTGPDARAVPVDHVLTVSAQGGELAEVTVRSEAGPLQGRMGRTGDRWVARDRLEPGTTYAVDALTVTTDGRERHVRSSFRTQDLTLDQQTFASVAPLAGETVGVGMPVVVTFDVPVSDRASIEKHLSVRSVPRQRGAWHWLSDTEVHWRPAKYWRAGTEVTVDLDVNSVSAGAGIYGQESRRIEFSVGAAHVYRVNARTHQMEVFSDGELLRTIPITTGKAGFTTRSGTKVIMEKFRTRRMNSETVGIGQDDPEFYDIDDVEYAMRLTYSGEFIHAAPWSVGSQGYANVSHGCTGMSTADAAWLYAMTTRGDVVEYTGTDRPMTLENGFGDWNLPFDEYASGSAL